MAKQTKFTPEKLEQIRTLVESGKNRQEIADLLGVTVGSLQVTCSRLGISLRRNKRHLASGGIQQSRTVQSPSHTQPPREGPPARAGPDPAAAKFAIKMRYKGEERTTDLPFTQDMIRQLAFEAQLRDMRIGDFLVELFMATMSKDLFQTVLGPDQDLASKQTQRAGSTAKECGPTAVPKKDSEGSE